MEWLKDHTIKGESGTLLLIYVQPGASKTAIKGEFASTPPRLKISVSAPPVEGEANALIIKFLADLLGVSKSRVHILSGETSRQKNIWVSGINANACMILISEK